MSRRDGNTYFPGLDLLPRQHRRRRQRPCRVLLDECRYVDRRPRPSLPISSSNGAKRGSWAEVKRRAIARWYGSSSGRSWSHHRDVCRSPFWLHRQHRALRQARQEHHWNLDRHWQPCSQPLVALSTHVGCCSPTRKHLAKKHPDQTLLPSMVSAAHELETLSTYDLRLRRVRARYHAQMASWAHQSPCEPLDSLAQSRAASGLFRPTAAYVGLVVSNSVS